MANRSMFVGLDVHKDSIDISEELGPRMLARVSKRTGLRPEDL